MEMIFRANRPTYYYIAVSEYGFGVHTVPAVAIRLAQAEVPGVVKQSPPGQVKPGQLLIYRTLDENIVPTGWSDGGPQWPANDTSAPPKRRGKKVSMVVATEPVVRLVGLTTTHSLFVQSHRVTFDKLPMEENINEET